MLKIVKQQTEDSRFFIQTECLNALGYSEISIENLDSNLISEAEAFLNHVFHYMVSGSHISPGETMAYGYWFVKFQGKNQNNLEAWEYSPDATEFIKGANLTLHYWREQNNICTLHQAEFAPPRPDKLTVVSAGVLEGLPVQAVRYPSPDHMSGWWITTDLYNGDIKTLKHEHTYHITASRPDLAKYLALPEGFRFDLSVKEDVWLDEKVLNSTP